jgi:hypothetical protein
VKNNNRSAIIVVIVVALLSGFLRQYVMVNINWVLKHLTLGAPNYSQSEFSFLLSWSPKEINFLKWGLTVMWSFYFFGITCLGVRYIFPNRSDLLKVTYRGYSGLIAIAGMIYVVGYLSSGVVNVYDAVRALMGIAQSFIPLMVFYLVFKFMLNENDYSEKE